MVKIEIKVMYECVIGLEIALAFFSGIYVKKHMLF